MSHKSHDHEHEHGHHHHHPEPKYFDKGIHPAWFMLVGAVLIGLTVLAWTLVVGF